MRPRLTITCGFMDVIHFKYRRRIAANAEPLYVRSLGLQQKIDLFTHITKWRVILHSVNRSVVFGGRYENH